MQVDVLCKFIILRFFFRMANNILIQEIEAVEENYQSTFRSILQNDSKLEDVCGQHSAVLEKRIVHHDREIERKQQHYQLFVPIYLIVL